MLVWLSQVDGDNQVGTLVGEGEGNEADSRSIEAGALAEIQEQDLKSDRSNSSELTIPLALSNPDILKDQSESEEGMICELNPLEILAKRGKNETGNRSLRISENGIASFQEEIQQQFKEEIVIPFLQIYATVAIADRI